MDVTPEYLPRLETLLPIIGAEEVVWRDDRPFSRQAWQNRTRLRNPDGWQWITVPVEHGQLGESIARTRIAYHDGWRKRHLKAFRYNYSTAPFYEHYAPDLEMLYDMRFETLGELNRAALEMMMRWLKRPLIWRPIEAPGPEASNSDFERALITFEHPEYAQNYDGFMPEMTSLDILLNHGPSALLKLART